jgi:uridine kinase
MSTVEIAARLAGVIGELAAGRARLAVAVDGPDAAGKTTLADSVAGCLGLPVVRACVDGFHQPREIRYRRGELSAEGCYRDSFDYPAITGQCLDPFRAGAPVIRTAGYDYRSDAPRDDGQEVPASAVLIFDGVFLLRPELAGYWDLAVHLQVREETIMRRALARDLGLFGSAGEVRRRYAGRYLPGQALYRAEAAPADRAHIVIGNDDPERPVVVTWQARGPALPAPLPSQAAPASADKARQSPAPGTASPG